MALLLIQMSATRIMVVPPSVLLNHGWGGGRTNLACIIQQRSAVRSREARYVRSSLQSTLLLSLQYSAWALFPRVLPQDAYVIEHHNSRVEWQHHIAKGLKRW
jgi:hypothetical protein